MYLLWRARPGRDARREFDYIRHGTVSILAAMNVTTGEVIAERIHRNDSQTFIRFLAMLHQMTPPHLRIHLIMDNGSSHTSRAWLAAHPRFAVTYTPKHAATTWRPRSPRSPSGTTRTPARTSGATTPTPSTPATSSATPSPNPPSRKPRDRNTR